MQLFGRSWTRRELEARVGRLEQIGGLRRLRLCEGPEAGVEQIQVRTGAGLSYSVSPQRCLDISLADYHGAALSWQARNGDVHPAYYDAVGLEWLRTAAGGLLMTCGLTQVGSPCEDGGEALGLHGRAHHLPASQVVAEGRWEGDEYEMRIAGVVEETTIFGEYLRLTREIRSSLGKNQIRIRDVVENVGFTPTPHMLLYHFNFGFPLLAEETIVRFPSRRVTPREPELPLEGYDRWQAPEAGHQERVYFHDELVHRENNGAQEPTATVTIHNPRFPRGGHPAPVSVRLTWRTDTLPRLVQWRMPGAGDHVLGVEPANCGVLGRAQARADGSLLSLQPGARLVYDLLLDVADESV